MTQQAGCCSPAAAVGGLNQRQCLRRKIVRGCRKQQGWSHRLPLSSSETIRMTCVVCSHPYDLVSLPGDAQYRLPPAPPTTSAVTRCNTS
eukprot:scaffold64505_cov35-Prasinocladus_malaysianus.AAC.3